MARKKTPPPPKSPERVSVVHLLGTVEERNWLTVLHESTHIPKATIVRLALTDWAKSKGLAAPPKR